MNEYSQNYLKGLASSEVQKKIIELISQGKTNEEILDELMDCGVLQA